MLTERTAASTAHVSSRRYLEMPQPSHRLHQIFLTQELLGKCLLHLPINVVKDNVRHPWAHSSPRHHRCGEYGPHPPRRFRKIPLRPVNHYHIPLLIIHLVRQPAQG
ncbi:hypothetical protein NMG60_11006836 [Bertholletia excelsa]